MNLEYTIPLADYSLQELLSIWYQLWELPFFRSYESELRTSDPETYGSYTFPAGMPLPVLEGMIRNIVPVSICIDVPDFFAQIRFEQHTLHLAGKGSLCQQVGQMLQRMAPTLQPLPYAPLTLTYDHTYLKAYRFKPNSGAVMLMRMQSIPGLNKRLQWAHLRTGSALQSGPVPENVRPYMLMVSDESGKNVIVCDVSNDRLVGFGNVPDLLNADK